MHLTVEMTEAELFALDMIAVDRQEWADNVLTNRARRAVDNLVSTDEWSLALAAHISDGGNPQDKWAVLLKGKEAGIFKTAAEKRAAQEIAESTEIPTPSGEMASPEAVDQQLILRKMALTKTSTRADLDEVVQRGLREGLALMQKRSEGALSDEDEARTAELQQFGLVMDALEAARDAIKADVESGEITTVDEIQTDVRWPST